METEVLNVNPGAPEAEIIDRAARLLRTGELVAFPTETVYGLGANALDGAAVERIFAAKGRPSGNPLIVHVSGAASAQQVAADWPDSARELVERFWPGPLTLVLRRGDRIPLQVTAGGNTVAVRSPSHPVARALLEAAGVPIAAPSANRSSEVSPTRAEHVLKSLGGRIPLILNGGPCPGGMESTVLDLTEDPPRLLRPGPITRSDLEETLGSVLAGSAAPGSTARSPGMMHRHYSPRARLMLAEDGAEEMVRGLLEQGKRVGWLAEAGAPAIVHPRLEFRQMPSDPRGYGALLYDRLHQLDDLGVDVIVVGALPAGDDWEAIRDRLTRAAARSFRDI